MTIRRLIARRTDFSPELAAHFNPAGRTWRESGSEWVVTARLNGDQSNQGRQLTMDSREVRIYRMRLYSASQ